jgi:hypothetical protein
MRATGPERHGATNMDAFALHERDLHRSRRLIISLSCRYIELDMGARD